jgi:hypothetical protein
MTSQPTQETAALREALRRWLDAIDQYKREVGLSTDPLKTFEERRTLVSIERQAELIGKITKCRDEYDEALRAAGRSVPHRLEGE